MAGLRVERKITDIKQTCCGALAGDVVVDYTIVIYYDTKVGVPENLAVSFVNTANRTGLQALCWWANNNNNSNTQDDIYSAVVIITRSLREFTRFI